MKPIKFEQVNATYAENQPEYNPLPVYKSEEGRVTSCWSLSIGERLHVLFMGKIYLSMLTFNKPLQPILMNVKNPYLIKKEGVAHG